MSIIGLMSNHTWVRWHICSIATGCLAVKLFIAVTGIVLITTSQAAWTQPAPVRYNGDTNTRLVHTEMFWPAPHPVSHIFQIEIGGKVWWIYNRDIDTKNVKYEHTFYCLPLQDCI